MMVESIALPGPEIWLASARTAQATTASTRSALSIIPPRMKRTRSSDEPNHRFVVCRLWRSIRAAAPGAQFTSTRSVMQFRRVSVDGRTSRMLLRGCVTLALLCTNAEAMADDVPSDVVDSPARQAFLAGTSKDCSGCDLRGVRLKHRDLSGADLTS